MKLEGTYTFDAPRDVVWQMLLDPTVLAKILPGCERLEQSGENGYKGILKIRVGPVQGTFQGLVKLLNINEPESYRIEIDGKGAPGFVKGAGEVRLESQGATTVIHYTGQGQVGGRIASVGQRLLDSSAKALTRQSLDSLNKQIQARQQATAAGEPGKDSDPTVPVPPSPPVEAPSETEFALGVAKEMLDDLLPAERRMPLLAAALGALALIVALNWWSNVIARKVADEIWKRGPS